MKRAFILAAFFLLAVSAAAYAQRMGPGTTDKGQQRSEERKEMERQYGYGPGWGYGMGPCMMGPGYGGYGMGPGMMGPGYGGYGMDYRDPEVRKFLDETRELRRNMNMKMFEYSEESRRRNPDPAKLGKLQEEMELLQERIRDKAPLGY